jgi:hypothetical protein
MVLAPDNVTIGLQFHLVKNNKPNTHTEQPLSQILGYCWITNPPLISFVTLQCLQVFARLKIRLKYTALQVPFQPT